MHVIRAYHAVLALLVLLAYGTSEWGPIHVWLGYGVALVILVRLGLAALGLPQLGLERFYPQFTGLNLDRITTHPAISRGILFAIAISLVTVTATGLIMDGGGTLSRADTAPLSDGPEKVLARDRERPGAYGEDGTDDDEEGGPLEEVHEFFGNLLLLLVGGHIAYLLTFKRPLARFMLYLAAAGK